MSENVENFHERESEDGNNFDSDKKRSQNKQEEEEYNALGESILKDEDQKEKEEEEENFNEKQEEDEEKETPQEEQVNENIESSQDKENNQLEEQKNKKYNKPEIKDDSDEEANLEVSSEHNPGLDHAELINLDENENVVIEPAMERSNESTATQKKFEKYLNEQIYKFGLSESPIDMRPSFAIGSPISLPYNGSLRSVDSSFYRPENFSLNLSRSYIPNFVSLGNPTIYEFSPLDSKEGIEKKLRFIFDYYAETYLQPTKKYDTFDAVGKRVMKFQSFTLFAKDFKLLKSIFKLDTIKKIYKKESEFGKVLQFSNFISLVEALSHEKECNSYFKLSETVPGMNNETKASLETRELYAYMGLFEDTEKLKLKFSKLFLPFNCEKEAELPKIKFNYKKMSLPDLHRKALPELRDNKSIKSRLTMKSVQKVTTSPFDNESEVLVSWQLLRSKSLKNTDAIKHSTTRVKKLIKEDPEDKIYLNEYREVKSIPRHMIEKKIKEMSTIEDKKTHRVIENLQKIDDKILKSKLTLQKKLSINKI